MKPVEYVEFILKNYQNIVIEVDRLKIELNNYKDESPQDTIQSLTYGQAPENDRVQSSKVGDRTSAVALIYRNVNRQINRIGKRELSEIIQANEQEIERVDRCIETLPQPLHDVIISLYIDGLSWEEICNEELISRTTLYRRRNKAISEIAHMMYPIENAG